MDISHGVFLFAYFISCYERKMPMVARFSKIGLAYIYIYIEWRAVRVTGHKIYLSYPYTPDIYKD